MTGAANFGDRAPTIQTVFSVRGDPPTMPSQVTDLLGIEASEIAGLKPRQTVSVNRGRQTLRFWIWRLIVGPEVSYDLPGQLDVLLERLRPSISRLGAAAPARGWALKVTVRSYIYDASPILTFRSDQLRQIADFDAEFEVVVEVPDDDGETGG